MLQCLLIDIGLSYNTLIKQLKQSMDIEDMDQEYPSQFQLTIDQQNMVLSYVLEGQRVLFPKVGIAINQSGITQISNPKDKITKVRIQAKNLKEFQILGKGKAGCVRRATYYNNGSEFMFAVKSVNAALADQRKQFLNDLKEFLKTQESQYLISFYTCFFKDGYVKLVLEYMDMGSLRRLVQLIGNKKIVLTEQQLATIMFKIIKGLQHIHTIRKSIHRDIKPENILFNSKGEVKITDFGVSKCIQNTFGKSRVGTYIYMGPQRLDPSVTTHSYKTDIWSLGIVLFELATGRNPFVQKGDTINVFRISTKIMNNPIPELPQIGFSPQIRSFLNKCLVKSQNNRASTEDLLSDSWLLQNKLPNLQGLIDRLVQLK